MAILISMYVIYVFTIVGMILCVQRKDRFASVLIALSFPLMIVIAVFMAAQKLREFQVKPCPEGLEEAEALVEHQRRLMFPGRAIEATIARSWQRNYAMSIEMQARKVRDISIEIREHLAAV